eukprot:89729_1
MQLIKCSKKLWDGIVEFDLSSIRPSSICNISLALSNTQDDEKNKVQKLIDEENQKIKKFYRSMYAINWMSIANCIQHEMYPKLANVIRATINDKGIGIGLYDLEQKYIDKMIEILQTKRNLALEETNYLRKLCHAAIKFDFNRRVFVDEIDGVQFKRKKLNNQTLLQDIFDVHNHFIFSNYHFENYSLQQFREDIFKVSSKYLDEDIVDKFIKEDKL